MPYTFFNSTSTGCIVFSFLFHSGLAFLLATVPKWQSLPLETIPLGTIEYEVDVISKTPLKGNTSQSILTKYPPQPATSTSKRTYKAPQTNRRTSRAAAMMIQPKPKKKLKKLKKSKNTKKKVTQTKKKIDKTKKKASTKKLTKKVSSFPLQLPKKNKPRFTQETKIQPNLQEMSPVVIVKQGSSPSNIENLKGESHTDQKKTHNRRQNNRGSVSLTTDLTDEINQEAQELESKAALKTATDSFNLNEEEKVSHTPLENLNFQKNVNSQKDLDFQKGVNQKTEAKKDIVPATRQPVAKLLTSHKKAIKALPLDKGTKNQAIGGHLGIPDGARLNTDLRQHPGNIPPIYPAVARQNFWEGTVTLSYQVTTKGRVREVKVVQSSGYHMLDLEAIRAIRRYRYLPGQQGKTYHPVTFRLSGPVQYLPSKLRASKAL